MSCDAVWPSRSRRTAVSATLKGKRNRRNRRLGQGHAEGRPREDTGRHALAEPRLGPSASRLRGTSVGAARGASLGPRRPAVAQLTPARPPGHGTESPPLGPPRHDERPWHHHCRCLCLSLVRADVVLKRKRKVRDCEEPSKGLRPTPHRKSGGRAGEGLRRRAMAGRAALG